MTSNLGSNLHSTIDLDFLKITLYFCHTVIINFKKKKANGIFKMGNLISTDFNHSAKNLLAAYLDFSS